MKNSNSTPDRITAQRKANYSIPSRYANSTRLSSLLKETFHSLLRKPPTTTFIIFALALAFPALIALLSGSLKSAENNLLENRHITVFLSPQVSDDEAINLAGNLAANTYIKRTAVSPITVSGTVLLTVDIQPGIKLNNAELGIMVNELNSHPSVEFVDADSAWLQDNLAAVKTTKTLALAGGILTALLTAALAFAVSYFDLLRYRPEYQTLNQLGASSSTVMKPLLLRTLLLASAAVSIGTLLAFGFIKILPVFIDMSTYGAIFPNTTPVIHLLPLIVVATLSSLLAVKLVGRKLLDSYISMT